MPRIWRRIVRSLFIIVVLVTGPGTNAAPLTGFTTAHAITQRQLEEKFDRGIQPSNLDLWMRRLTAEPHHAGSPASKKTVRFLQEIFEQWGYTVRLDVYSVLVPSPTHIQLELVSPVSLRMSSQEPPLPGQDELQSSGILPIHNSYSADGDVRAEVVYVNYGRVEDYEYLKQSGVNVSGKIVIARLGKIWRGLKPKLAAANGAVGAVLYSDPRDDGYFQGRVLPGGPFRPSTGAERGSVMDITRYPGDPLTPFLPAVEGVPRLTIEEAETLTSIPVLPITYADAQRILAEMKGPLAPLDWRGALATTYVLGPGPAELRLKLHFEQKQVEITNVIASMKGSDYPDQWIIRGNHHDAWVYGAADPVSGVVALMEEARVIASLRKQGWRPKRTILFALWDAEEHGMIGSTEWVEQYKETLLNKAAIYINSDLYSKGYLEVGGSHSLQKFVSEISEDVIDPQDGVGVGDRLRAFVTRSGREFFNTSSQNIRSAKNGMLPMMPLGGGSDFSPFLHHLGIATLQIGYFGEGLGGEFHSRYDNYNFYQKFGDPDFRYGEVMVQTTGRAILRLANADWLPFGFTELSDNIELFLTEIHNISGQFSACDENGAKLNFEPVFQALKQLRRSAVAFDHTLQSPNWVAMPADRKLKVNTLLFNAERKLTESKGLPGRPWYRHMIYAPGTLTGYDVKTVPALREALESGNCNEASEQIHATTHLFLRFSDYLDNTAMQLDAVN